MSTFIKSNIEARFSSLIEGTHRASLFQTNRLSAQGVYLQPHQEHNGESGAKETIILQVFRGTGELCLIEHGAKPLYLQIMGGDVFVIPTMSVFKVLNTDQENLVLSEIAVR